MLGRGYSDAKSESQVEVDLMMGRPFIQLFEEQLQTFLECQGRFARISRAGRREFEAPRPVPQPPWVFQEQLLAWCYDFVYCQLLLALPHVAKISCPQESLPDTIGLGERKLSLRRMAFQLERNSTRGQDPCIFSPEFCVSVSALKASLEGLSDWRYKPGFQIHFLKV